MLDAKRDVSKGNVPPAWQRDQKVFRLTEHDPRPIRAVAVGNTTTEAQDTRWGYCRADLALTAARPELLGVRLVPVTRLPQLQHSLRRKMAAASTSCGLFWADRPSGLSHAHPASATPILPTRNYASCKLKLGDLESNSHLKLKSVETEG